jgi:hypothetical protein
MVFSDERHFGNELSIDKTDSINGSSWVAYKHCSHHLYTSNDVMSTAAPAMAADDSGDEQLTSSTTCSNTVVIPTAFVHRRNERERERVR